MRQHVWRGVPVLFAGSLIGSLSLPAMAQAESAPKVQDQTAAEVDVTYAPSPAYPNGRMNPDAPPEVAQFAFMVGEFDCIDEMRQRRERHLMEHDGWMHDVAGVIEVEAAVTAVGVGA